MTSAGRRIAAVVGIVAGVVLAVVAVILWRTGIRTSSYPPVELDGRVVSGPYELTEYSGSHIGGATIVALVAILALGFSIRAIVVARRHPRPETSPSVQ